MRSVAAAHKGLAERGVRGKSHPQRSPPVLSHAYDDMRNTHVQAWMMRDKDEMNEGKDDTAEMVGPDRCERAAEERYCPHEHRCSCSDACDCVGDASHRPRRTRPQLRCLPRPLRRRRRQWCLLGSTAPPPPPPAPGPWGSICGRLPRGGPRLPRQVLATGGRKRRRWRPNHPPLPPR